MSSRQAIIILTVVFLLTLPFLAPVLRGDGVGYYAYLRSFALDCDFDFRNEFLKGDKLRLYNYLDDHGQIKNTEVSKTGLIKNSYSIGCSLLWLPFFILGHIIAILKGFPKDGYSLPYIYCLGFGTALYAFLGLIFIFKLCRRYFSALASLIAVLSLWFASNLVVYMYFLTFMSHSLSLFGVSICVFFWHRTLFKKKAVDWLILGALGGLISIIYYVNSVFLLLGILEYLSIAFPKRGKSNLNTSAYAAGLGILFICGILLVSFPNFAVKKIIYGTYFVTGYEDQIGTWSWLRPRFIQVLFSGRHGLFSWNPVYLAAVAGWLFFYKKDKPVFFYSGVTFLVFFYVISISQVDTAPHSSFGARTFISCMPLFALGLSYFIEYAKIKKRLLLVCLFMAILTTWNLGFMFQWGTNMVSRRNPISWQEMVYNQVSSVPKRLSLYLREFFARRGEFVSKVQEEDAKRCLQELSEDGLEEKL